MRVIAGKAKSLPLIVPQGIRPTTDVVRESLFASLGPAVQGARFADLYAGSGAVGIEALSRGAQQVVFVENNRRSLEGIKTNLENTKLAQHAVVVAGPVLERWPQVAAEYGPFDIVFVDPPYQSDDWQQIANWLLVQREGVADEGLVIIQHERSQPVAVTCEAQQSKIFGQTQLDFFYIQQARQEEKSSE